jgi:uncharacterized membrane protein
MTKKSISVNIEWAWWYIPVIPALGRLRQEDQELEASLDYKAKPCLTKSIYLHLYIYALYLLAYGTFSVYVHLVAMGKKRWFFPV